MSSRGRLATALGCSILSVFAAAQQPPVSPRIQSAINDSRLTFLRGNTHPLARAQFDRGPAPDDLPLQRMLLVLRRSPEQRAALATLLAGQQDKSSPLYHRWLSPQEFGRRFGPADSDVQAIVTWVAAHGFQVTNLSRGRTVIEFSGSAAEVAAAFHTQIHQYVVNGEQHWANASDPAIPAALAPVVAGIASLHNFSRKPLYRRVGADSGPYLFPPHIRGRFPFSTGDTGCGLNPSACYAVTPFDLAAIYNVLPLWNSSPAIDGSGQTIAIVGQSDIYAQDVSDFRRIFGLPAAHFNIIHNGPAPGNRASQGDEMESDLDVEWAGAMAPGATVDLVASASTNTTAGVDLSAEYIVDNNLAPVMSESYGACELEMGAAGNLFYEQLWQQAAAQGISVFVAAGDSGSAVCDQGSALATQGLAVNGVSSTPYDTAVGGTDFDDLQDATTYWNATNNPSTHASAKGYVPEETWNDSCTNSEFFSFIGASGAEADCNASGSRFWPFFLAPVGGSGGASNCTAPAGQSAASCAGGYAKPSWQAGPGVPADNKRDLPDVSLFAAAGLNASFYLICETDIYGGCGGDFFNAIPIGGTSASAPVFAALMALVNQKHHSRQGNANYVLYPLAAQPGASCDSSGANPSACIFHDVTKGTIAMPCASGSLNCVTATSGDQNGVLAGYSAGAGYDLATGLGSVNAANLVNNWTSVGRQATTAVLSLSPTTQLQHGSAVSVHITVSPQAGEGTPTGLVSLLTGSGQPAGMFTLANGSVSGTTRILPGGNYSVTAHYEGDDIYAPSDSEPAGPVTITPEPSTTTLQAFTLDQNGNATPYAQGPYGQTGIYLSAQVAGQSGQGAPSGSVNLTQTLNGLTTAFAGDPFPLDNRGYTIHPLFGDMQFFSPGQYSIAASYGGDASFNPDNATPIGFTVTPGPTSTSLNIVPCSSYPGPCNLNTGTLVVIFASVQENTSPFVPHLPSGTVTFYSNGKSLASPVAVDSSIVPPVASLSTEQLPVGLNNITAQYSGDTNYTGSTSGTPFPVDVGGTFTITANPTVINVPSPGQSGSTTLTFTAQNGFTGSTILLPSLCSGLPPQSVCSFNPPILTFTSSQTTVPVTLTVITTGSPSADAGHGRPDSWPGRLEIALLGAMGICVTLPGLRRSRRTAVLAAVVAVAILLFSVSCGGGATSVSPPVPASGGGGGTSNTGTPAGNYTGVTVTVSINNVTQWLYNLTVNVQ